MLTVSLPFSCESLSRLDFALDLVYSLLDYQLNVLITYISKIFLAFIAFFIRLIFISLSRLPTRRANAVVQHITYLSFDSGISN